MGFCHSDQVFCHPDYRRKIPIVQLFIAKACWAFCLRIMWIQGLPFQPWQPRYETKSGSQWKRNEREMNERENENCILIDKIYVISIYTGSVSPSVSAKRQLEPLQNGLCHQGTCLLDSAFVPCSDLLSTNARAVIRVMINMSTVMPARLWLCRWVDFRSSFLKILITWQTEEPEDKSEQTLIWRGIALHGFPS